MKEKKATEIPRKLFERYLQEKRIFEVFRKVEETTKVSMELGAIKYVNPYLSSIAVKSKISGEYYGS